MRDKFNPNLLNEKGLNLQAIFDIGALPIDMIDALEKSTADLPNYNQLILIGHGGSALWNSITSESSDSSNPIDDFSVKTMSTFFERNLPGKQFKFLYPGETIIPLQSLGTLAGWHHPSLFRIGINKKWGSWFAYRAVVLAASNYEASVPMDGASPCVSCTTTECISACPAGAVQGNDFEFQKCFNYRLEPNSKCKDRCLARISCPVAQEARYPLDQIKYHYGRSLKSMS